MMGLQEIVAANEARMASVTSGVDDVREYVAQAIDSFVEDQPDSDFQRGYLAALLAVAKEALHEDMHATPYCEGEALANGRPFCRLCDKDKHLARVRDLAFS